MQQTATATKPIDRIKDAFSTATGPNDAGWYSNPDNPKFDFRENEDGSVVIHSWTGKTTQDILSMGGLSYDDLYRNKRTSSQTHDKLDVVTLSHAKLIPWQFLYALGLSDGYRYKGYNVVKIPYHLPDGTEHTKIRVRKAMDGKYKQFWDEGTPGEIIPYGLHKLPMAFSQGYLTIGEGESDAWACWLNGVPYLGIPGAGMAKKLLSKWGKELHKIPRIYILHEPDQVEKLQSTGQGFYKDARNTLRVLGYQGEIFCVHFKKLTGHKDPSDLHIQLFGDKQYKAFKGVFEEALQHAIADQDIEASLIIGCGHPAIDAAITAGDRQSLLSLINEFARLSERQAKQAKFDIKTVMGNTFPMREFDELLQSERDEIEAERQLPQIKSAYDLMKMQFPPLDWRVPKIVPPGLIALAGKQKIGKSWFDLQLCMGIASGGKVLGDIPVIEGDTLYLALEDNDMQMQDRIQTLLAPGEEAPKRFEYVTQWPRMDKGGIEAIERWILSKEYPRLIIIDPWVKVKPRLRLQAGQTGYDADYESLESIHKLANKYHISIIVQFHIRKEVASDPFDELNGSSGITACADGFLLLKRPRKESIGTLYGTGRVYKEEVDLAVELKDGYWSSCGPAEHYAVSKASREVLEVLNQAEKPLHPKEIASRLGVADGLIRKRLFDMKEREEVKDTGNGYISIVILGNGSNGGNGGNGGNGHKTVTSTAIALPLKNNDVTVMKPHIDRAREDSVTSVTSVTTDRPLLSEKGLGKCEICKWRDAVSYWKSGKAWCNDCMEHERAKQVQA